MKPCSKMIYHNTQEDNSMLNSYHLESISIGNDTFQAETEFKFLHIIFYLAYLNKSNKRKSVVI